MVRSVERTLAGGGPVATRKERAPEPPGERG